MKSPNCIKEERQQFIPKDCEQVKVYCRIRPQNEMENNFASSTCVKHIDEKTIKLVDSLVYNDIDSCLYGYNFSFDRILPIQTSQQDLYDEIAPDIVSSILSGLSHTLLAYGQTASGKTYSMIGDKDIDNRLEHGLVPRLMFQLFTALNEKVESDNDSLLAFSVEVSMVEVYLERVRDLLNGDNSRELKIRQTKNKGVSVIGCEKIIVTHPSEVIDILIQGQERRETSTTFLNPLSSRSHLIIFVEVDQTHGIEDSQVTRTLKSKLCLGDLAGSEKLDKTNAKGKLLYEARNINRSLSALGAVIKVLASGNRANRHIPYRDSKLTRLLQSSLGGRSKASFLLCCSASAFNYEETLSTLRFGKRMKQVKTHAKPCEGEANIAQLKYLLNKANQEISELREQLQDKSTKLEDKRSDIEDTLKPSVKDISQEEYDFKFELNLLKQEMKTENNKLKQQISALEHKRQPDTKKNLENEQIEAAEQYIEKLTLENKRLAEALKTEKNTHATNRFKLEQRLKESNREVVNLNSKLSKYSETEQTFKTKLKEIEISKNNLILETKVLKRKLEEHAKSPEQKKAGDDFRDVIIETLKKKVSTLMAENKTLLQKNNEGPKRVPY